MNRGKAIEVIDRLAVDLDPFSPDKRSVVHRLQNISIEFTKNGRDGGRGLLNKFLPPSEVDHGGDLDIDLIDGDPSLGNKCLFEEDVFVTSEGVPANEMGRVIGGHGGGGTA